MQSFNELTRARGDLASGDFVEAESRLLALAKSEPSMLEVHVALGELYLRSRRPENSVAAFRRALALSAADPSIISALATAELQAGRPQEALDLLGVAMSTSAEEPRFHFVAGRAWLAKSDLPAARREFEALLRLNPRAAAAMVELAGIAIAEKNAEEAKRWAGKALAIDPRARGARLFLAQALEESGDREAAWRMALAERENSPDDFRTAFYLAELAARRGEDAAIEPYLRATIELEPRFVTAYLTLARHLLRRGGDAADGVRLTQRAMELGLSDRDRALAHFLLADFYNRLGREDLSRRNAVLGRRFAASK